MKSRVIFVEESQSEYLILGKKDKQKQLELLDLATHVVANLSEGQELPQDILKDITSIQNEIKGLIFMAEKGSFQVAVDLGITNLRTHIDDLVLKIGEIEKVPDTLPEG